MTSLSIHDKIVVMINTSKFSKLPQNYLDPIICPEHHTPIYPELSKKGFRYFNCKVDFPTTHFVNDPDQELCNPPGFDNNVDFDYPKEHQDD